MKRLLILLGAVFFINAEATQVKVVRNYDELQVTASIKEPNNILLEGDRILQMKAPANTLVDACNGKPNCKLIDESTGILTFLPSPLYQTRAFTINLLTENGLLYNVRVEPKPISSQTIILKAYQKPVIHAHAPNTSGYERVMVHFLKALVNGTVPEGFAQTIPITAPIYKAANTQIKRLLTVNGNHMSGEIFELANITNKPLVIQESWFNWPGTKGIAVGKLHLAPFEKTRLYRMS